MRHLLSLLDYRHGSQSHIRTLPWLISSAQNVIHIKVLHQVKS